MDILIGLLVLAALVGFVWGFWKLFRKGERRRGLISLALSFCAVMLGGVLAGTKNERDAIAAGFASYEEQEVAEVAKQEQLLAEARALRLQQAREEQDQLDTAARDLGYSDYEHQQRAELDTQQEKAREARQVLLGDFPNTAIKDRASELGIVRYAAYQQLRNIDAIRSYCGFYDAGWQIEDVKRAQIEAGGNEEMLTAKAEADYHALRESYNMQFGLVEDEVVTLSNAGHWLKYCDAFKKSWGVFGVNSAARTNRQTARDVQDALTLVFLEQLNRDSASQYFNR